ncbi:MAG: hypothetical protein ACOCTT_03480 [archaeon]
MKKTPPEDIVKMVEHKKEGKTNKEIASEFGVHEGTVSRLHRKGKKYGLDKVIDEKRHFKEEVRICREIISSMKKVNRNWKTSFWILLILWILMLLISVIKVF